MSRSETKANQENQTSDLDDMSAVDLLEYLDSNTKDELNNEFAEGLDQGDVFELAFTVIDNNETTVGELSLRMAGAFKSFLERKQLRFNNADEIERNYREQNGEDEDEDEDAERFDGQN